MSESKPESKILTEVHAKRSLQFSAMLRDIPTVPPDAVNTHLKSRYATLAQMRKYYQPVLNKHGFALSFSPPCIEGNEKFISFTMYLLFPDGFVDRYEIVTIVEKPTCQGIGSAATYAKREAIGSLLMMVTADDDDGQAASTPSATPGQKRAAKKQPNGATEADKLRAEIRKVAMDTCGGDATRASAWMLDTCGHGKPAMVPDEQLQNCLNILKQAAEQAAQEANDAMS
jgi:hypothetical protein